MLAPSTLNMFPKFELAPILMYLTMLPKILRPSSTPSASTSRLFSSRMMSADSLAISTAVSTEIPTSALFSAGPSLMPSPRKPTTCPAQMQGFDDPRLLRRRHLGEDGDGLEATRQLLVGQLVEIGAEQDIVCRAPPPRGRSCGR